MDSSVLNEFGGSPRLSLDCITSVAVPPLSTCMMASRTFTYSEIPFSLAYFFYHWLMFEDIGGQVHARVDRRIAVGTVVIFAGNQYPEKENDGEKDRKYRTYDKDTL